MASPPPPATVFQTTVEFVASGNVEDYTAAVQDEIIGNFATLLGIDASRISIEIVSASVRIIVTITSPTSSAASALESTVTTQLNTVAAVTSTIMPAGFTVETVPVVETTEVLVSSISPPPPSTTSDDAAGGLSGGIIVVIILGVLVLIGGPAGYVYYQNNQKKDKDKEPPTAGDVRMPDGSKRSDIRQKV